ncbi:cyclic nucleotide-binding domain-containing protein [Piscinibacter sakaiensis]|uniref:cyclic nucleotide-binding domain-containing protein n=1 Tax=Piscinibacter sakaiensis TaxID=1547922 RepID=UPI003AABDEB6
MQPPSHDANDARSADDPQAGRGARPLTSSPALAELATELLVTSAAIGELSADEAACVVGYMGLVGYPAGATVLREGDAGNTSYLLLILSGEVTVETADPVTATQVPISVLGPGNVIGEMGLIDGSPRSASCIAATPLQAAGLTRKALQRLIDEQPKVAARLMVGLCKRLADRLRGLGEQLQIYSRLNTTLQQQLDRLAPRSR